MTAAEFLESLWGPRPRGFIGVWTLADRRSTYLQDPAAAANFRGQPDVFCAVGMTTRPLGARQRAKAHQVAAICGMWLDLDVGDAPGNLPNRTVALSFANRHLRPTITVDSGRGVHAWYLLDGGPWIFKTIKEQIEAAGLARRFVALHQRSAAQHGWLLDPVGDLARLMRLPDTVNAKDPDDLRLVTVIEGRGPRHTLAALRALLRDVSDNAPGTVAGVGRGLARAPVNLHDARLDPAKLAALLHNSRELEQTWEHQRADLRTMSEIDMSLASQAAHAGLQRDECIALLVMHRLRWDPSDPKARRVKYLELTVEKAMASVAQRSAA